MQFESFSILRSTVDFGVRNSAEPIVSTIRGSAWVDLTSLTNTVRDVDPRATARGTTSHEP